MMIFHSRLLQHLITIAGLQMFTLTPASAHESGCYYWIMSNSPQDLTDPSSGTRVITYDLWIVNLKYASSGEILRDTATPSVFSKRLSDEFYCLGQEPSVQLVGRSTENFDGLESKVAFNEGLSVWNVTFEALMLLRYLGQTLLISGKFIAFYECAVGDVTNLIKIKPGIRYDTGTVQAQNGMLNIGVIMEPCDKKTMLLLTSGGVFVSQDSLLTTQKLALPEFGNSPVSLLGAVILLIKFKTVAQHMILVTNQGIFHITSDQFGTEALNSTRITMQDFSMMTGVVAAKWMCDLHSMPRVVVKDVRFTGHRVSFCVLMFDPVSKGLTVSKVDPNSAQHFRELGSWHAFIGSDKYTMTVAGIGITAFYVWNDMVVYYYFGPNTEERGMMKIAGTSNVEIGSPTDAIKQFVITLKTEIAISLNSGTMFYSKVMFKQVWKVQMTLDPGSVLSSDETGNFFTVKLDNGVVSSRIPINLSYKTVAQESLTLKCPYKDFQMSGKDMLNAFKMDLGDEIRIWSLVFLPEGVDDSVIKVQFEELDVIDAEESSIFHWEEFGVSQYKEIRFSIKPKEINRFPSGNTYLGHFGFQLEPVVDDPGLVVCPFPHMMFGYMYVGCSDFKYLQIVRGKEDDKECDIFRGKEAPYKYTLYSFQIMYPNGSYGTQDKIVEYDYAKYGCPITIHYSDVLLPKFELVDDFAKTVKSIDVDFVIFELYNRLFEYNSSVSNIACTAKPQNWKDMVALSGNETNMEFIWTPANYRSCHVNYSETGEDMEDVHSVINDPYQILNGSYFNGLTFTQHGSLGLYVFTAVIVNPNVSLCHLSSTFAVNVIGKVVRRDFLGLYIALGTFAVLLTIFVLTTYFYYREHVYGK